MSMNETRNWSPQQEAYFSEMREGSRNVILRARAGTGKTTTIVEGFKHAYESQILYCVFNKKNQLEAKSKIQDPRVQPLTLHSLGYRYICRVWNGVKPDASVEVDRVMELIGKDAPDAVVMAIVKLVGIAKNTIIDPDVEVLEEIADDKEIDTPEFEAEVNGGWTVRKLAEAAAGAMELSKHRDEKNRISFDDMVWLPVACGFVRGWFNLAVVDEGQDLNQPQFEMIKRCVKPGGRIIIVGDDRQAIYIFRGATSGGMDLMRDALDAAELGLTITYRCPKTVVEIAKAYVPDYEAHPSAPEGITLRCSEDQMLTQVRVGDAVISRANAPLMPLCLSLLRRGIRAKVEGRDIGKALLALVRKIKGRSNLSIAEFLKKTDTWRNKQTDRILAKAKRPEAAEEHISRVNDQADTLLTLAQDLASVSELETRIDSLFTDQAQGQAPCVIFTTTHKAKGLEWDNVFILSHTFMKRRILEEENIYYVAITRTKKVLTLVS